MAYKVIILYQLYMPSYFLGTFTEYPFEITSQNGLIIVVSYNLFEIIYEYVLVRREEKLGEIAGNFSRLYFIYE